MNKKYRIKFELIPEGKNNGKVFEEEIISNDDSIEYDIVSLIEQKKQHKERAYFIDAWEIEKQIRINDDLVASELRIHEWEK